MASRPRPIAEAGLKTCATSSQPQEWPNRFTCSRTLVLLVVTATCGRSVAQDFSPAWCDYEAVDHVVGSRVGICRGGSNVIRPSDQRRPRMESRGGCGVSRPSYGRMVYER